MHRSLQRTLLSAAAAALLDGVTPPARAAAPDSAAFAQPGYAIVVSKKTRADAGWGEVVETLRARHGARVFDYDGEVESVLPGLRAQFPRYACFVATPAEAGREFVAQVHRLTRRLDDDPYTDCLWGILTGYDASNALAIARCTQPLVVRKALAGTALDLDRFEEGVWYSESQPRHMVRKTRGGRPEPAQAPAADTTAEIAGVLNGGGADLFVTSGHATERDWQLGYAYRNGQFRCEQGALFGLDLQGRRWPVHSPNPKVYLPVGNCLMGHIDGPDAMALAFLNSGGVRQAIGYTVPTWYGYAGWGCLDYFVEQPGRFNLAEAFFANQQALLHRLAANFPELLGRPSGTERGPPPQVGPAAAARGLGANDGRGLLYDRDTLAFYGDPAWDARLAPAAQAWDQTLAERDGVFTFEIRPRRGADSFGPLDTNGSQRGGRPFFQFLPRRVSGVELVEGADLQPLVTDNFLLVPLPIACDPNRTYRIVFRAR